MMDGLKISIPQRILLLRITLTLSLFVSVFLTTGLWAGYRLFPRVPLFPELRIPVKYDVVWIGLALLFWLCSLFLRRQRLFVFLGSVMAVLLALLDLNRLQPWFYIYNVLLLVVIFYNGRVDDPNKFTSIFIILQLIFASVYFYAGISQMNADFSENVFPDIIQPLNKLMSERQFVFFTRTGRIVPFVMLFIGLGFVISPMRYLSIALAILLHSLLLIFLFPSARNTNYALWFSNLSFLVISVLLFSGKTKQRYFSPTFLFKMPLFYLTTALFLVAPAFNMAGKWPDFLSFNQRSGNNKAAMVTLSAAAHAQLPPYLRHFCKEWQSGFVIDYEAWCRHETGADCFPEKLVFTALRQHLQNLTGTGVKDVQLTLLPARALLVKP